MQIMVAGNTTDPNGYSAEDIPFRDAISLIF